MEEISTFIAKHALLSNVLIGLLILLVIVEWLRAKRNSFSISPAQATQLINHDNAVVVDVRPEEAYRRGHIIDAYSIPAIEMKAGPKKIEKFKTRPIILVCDTGLESQKIAASLIKAGYNIYSLVGGMRNWLATQMPVVKS